jgi:hypothetical protein
MRDFQPDLVQYVVTFGLLTVFALILFTLGGILSGQDATAAMLKVLELFVNRSDAGEKIAPGDGRRDRS